jgi:hypothetical protein
MPIPCITSRNIKGEGENGEVLDRRVTVINGMCFYESTGRNSHSANTWFPILGLMTEKHPFYKAYSVGPNQKPIGYFFKVGELMTENEHSNPPDFMKKMSEIFKFSPYQEKDLWYRFGGVIGLLVSSQLGGGLWATPEGVKFKNHLKVNYPEFYMKYPILQVEKNAPVMTNPEEINKWITKNEAHFKILPKDLKKFIEKQTSTFKKQLSAPSEEYRRTQLTPGLNAATESKGVLNKIAERIAGPTPSKPPLDEKGPSRRRDPR